MVDEFQDSAPRQVELFDLVAGGDEERGIFLVGDELQSIYGFRHADVEVFRARRARWPSATGPPR
jgi:ATP-dependent helicase/nuclease subunit A